MIWNNASRILNKPARPDRRRRLCRLLSFGALAIGLWATTLASASGVPLIEHCQQNQVPDQTLGEFCPELSELFAGPLATLDADEALALADEDAEAWMAAAIPLIRQLESSTGHQSPDLETLAEIVDSLALEREASGDLWRPVPGLAARSIRPE